MHKVRNGRVVLVRRSNAAQERRVLHAATTQPSVSAGESAPRASLMIQNQSIPAHFADCNTCLAKLIAVDTALGRNVVERATY